MARTNVCVAYSGVLGCVLFVFGCDVPAVTLPVPRVAAAPIVSAVVTQPLIVSEEAMPTAPETKSVVGPNFAVLTDESRVHAGIAPEVITEPEAAPAPAALHTAELRGRVELHMGKRLTIEPLVSTSSTYPVPGCSAHVWIEDSDENGATDWEIFAEARVTTPLVFGVPLELEIVDEYNDADDPKPARPALQKGSRVRVQWEWE